MFKLYSLLLAGVLIVSSSSLLVRWTGVVSPTVISFYRLAISAVLLLGYHSFQSRSTKSPLSSFHWHYILAGFFLACHFIGWMASLQMTTIANSIFLESTHPIFAVIVSAIFLKEYPGKKSIPVFILACAGMILIVYPDLGHESEEILGDILAIVSALCLALYLLIARLHRSEADLIKYLIYIYGSAAVFCALYILAEKSDFTGYDLQTWWMMILLALGPNLLGHSLLNWSSRHLQIFKVNMIMLMEPVLATSGGMIFFAEFPPLNFYVGAGTILLAVGILVYMEQRK